VDAADSAIRSSAEGVARLLRYRPGVLHHWRRLRAPAQDALVAVAILLTWFVAMDVLRQRVWLPRHPQSHLVAAWAAALAMAFRRVTPRAVLVAVVVAYPLVYRWSIQTEFHLLPVLVAGYAATSTGRERVWVAGGACVVATAVLFNAVTPDSVDDWSRLLFAEFVVAGTVFLGAVMHEQRRTAVALAARNAELERLREVEAGQVLAEERTRIARELHDVVAHHMSAIVIRAQAADRVAASRPEVAVDAVGWIAGAGREALHAVRQTVKVLRTADGADASPASALAPAPTLADLPAMAARLAGAGLRVDVHLPDPLPPLDPQTDLAAVRIAQESLTNVLRHARARRAVVAVDEHDGVVRVEVHDDGATRRRPPTEPRGHGLRGMAERAALCGGRVDISVSPLGGWLVRAELRAGRAAAAVEEPAWSPLGY
jgi:signal transduction histidine kinase